MDERDFLRDALRRLGLWRGPGLPDFQRLTGGVSSDIWRIELPDGPVCVKRALAKLRVEADWRAPVERNAYEVAWMKVARQVEPAAAPQVLAHDAQAGLFAMPFLDPATNLLWKDRLRDGDTDAPFAAEVGRRIARIHAATAGDSLVARRFPTGTIFHAIRLEPYLETPAVRHPDLRETLFALSQYTGRRSIALVHGDVSPKNILVGPAGPVFLDAECAWYGDPAFDIAFCLNHLLLKCLWNRDAVAGYLGCFGAMAESWLGTVDWESREQAEARAAALLPGLFLGRVDGRSPVEYLTGDGQRDRVRRVARQLLFKPVPRLEAVRAAWKKDLEHE